MKHLNIFIAFLILISASTFVAFTYESHDLSGDEIVDLAIKAAGGDVIANSKIEFKFRKHYYEATRKDGNVTMKKCFDKDCSGQRDVLINSDFSRFGPSREDPNKVVEIEIAEDKKARMSGGVNSVHYFSILPYNLKDGAVKKELVGTVELKGEPYYTVKVTFEKEGGGEDHDDEYLYWFHKDCLLYTSPSPRD